VSSTRARLTALGAAVIVLALGATSVFVWNSPSNPVTQVLAANAQEVESDRMLTERNALLSQIVDLRAALASSKETLTASQEQQAALQQALWSAEGTLEAMAANESGSPKAPTKAPAKSPTTAAITAPSKAEIVNPASRYFGMYTEQAPFNWATFDGTADKIGSTPNAVGYFGGWDEAFRPSAVTRSWQRGTLPILTWESRPIGSGNDRVEEPEYQLPAIIGDPAAGVAGSHDDYIRQYARDIIATGLPLGIRLNHEMNGIWYPWSETDGAGNSINGNRPGDFVKMWQHVHDIFEQEGANSLVVWIWSPNIINNLPASNQPSSFLDGLYPGDDYVDWVGLSGYLRPAYKPDNDFSFDYTFGRSLAELRRISTKPIFLTEIGASETGGQKAAWIASLFEALAQPVNADIIGFSWFSLAVTSYVEGERATNDWRIDSRADSTAAFAIGLSLPNGRFDLAAR
jgi:hypothetical protein